MSEINQKIIDMINGKASANDISTALGITNKQLFYRLNLLKNRGYNIRQKYYYNGDIVYEFVKKCLSEDNQYTILTDKKDTSFKALFISDLHFGNFKDGVESLDKMYDYCTKEGINIIINAGDFIDGFSGFKQLKRFSNPEDQIDYAIKFHPYDKNIINFLCLGDHDYEPLAASGFDIANILRNKRHDIIPIGYGIGILNIKNDQIIVRHASAKQPVDIKLYNSKLIINGHSHKDNTIISDKTINMYLPSLSNLKTSANDIFPGAIQATISFINGYFKVGVFKHLIIYENKIITISESQYEMSRGMDVSRNLVKNEEVRGKTPMSKSIPSQIDKFNQRYYNK